MGKQELEPVVDVWILKEMYGEMVPGLCWESVEVPWWWPQPGREGGTALCALCCAPVLG